MSSNRILVVEDRADAAETLVSFFSRRGYELRVTPEGREARVLAVTWQPAVVLLDGMLKDVSGEDILCDLRRDVPGICVIMLTGQLIDEAACRRLRDLGVTEVFQKPVSLGRLAGLLSSLTHQGAGAAAAMRSESSAVHKTSAGDERRHQIRSSLGVIRNQCEMYLADSQEGLHAALTEEQRRGTAEGVMQRVIELVDQIVREIDHEKMSSVR